MAERKNEEPQQELVTSLSERWLKLERIFDAPRALVFEACSKKEHMDRWMCPNGFTIPDSGGEFRVGGKWYSNMLAPDGEGHNMIGEYEKIVPNELIVTSHAWLGDDGKPEHWSTLTFRFEDTGEGKTRLTLEHANLRSDESRNNHVGGWKQCIEKLGALLEKLQGRA
jgi:uncharacterized protein YndB with AHSA1/START domain